MKYPTFILLAAMALLLLPTAAEARIGESKNSLENRLFRNGGIIFRDLEKRASRKESGPYSPYLDYLGSAEVRVYFKSDDGSNPSQSDIDRGTLGTGWEMHVLYVKGKSVLEYYKRVGSMSEYEMNALLTILGGGNYWKEAEPVPAEGAELGSEEEEPPPTTFGFDYVRSDESVRAKKSGGGLLVFQKQLDEFLAKQHETSLLKDAPTSVQGF